MAGVFGRLLRPNRGHMWAFTLTSGHWLHWLHLQLSALAILLSGLAVAITLRTRYRNTPKTLRTLKVISKSQPATGHAIEADEPFCRGESA